jgi:hypothetical protein
MLAACRLAGLSALEGHYVGFHARTQFGATQRPSNRPKRQRRIGGLSNDEPFGVEQSVVARWEERERAAISRFPLKGPLPVLAKVGDEGAARDLSHYWDRSRLRRAYGPRWRLPGPSG